MAELETIHDRSGGWTRLFFGRRFDLDLLILFHVISDATAPNLALAEAAPRGELPFVVVEVREVSRLLFNERLDAGANFLVFIVRTILLGKICE